MQKEVKRTGWKQFCKKFSRDNQYRTARLVKGTDVGTEILLGTDSPFLGIVLEKKGRFIDGIQLLAGQGDAEHIANPILSVRKPKKMVLHQDKNGNASRLEVNGEDGDTVALEFESGKERSQFYGLVEKVAYNLYERRGSTIGDDWTDWLTAEKKIREAELEITE